MELVGTLDVHNKDGSKLGESQKWCGASGRYVELLGDAVEVENNIYIIPRCVNPECQASDLLVLNVHPKQP